ncbi:helix-turn-helix domain-containing protein [Mucilaginibacter gynuensis]|uniref:Helix-turn-helix domain-containing protein n=1 Tax=Mucilaginibacter gynuensis TaxID=1302236 RepID=A0ABP8G3Z4_9SPHI
MKISLLVYEGAISSSISSVTDIFGGVNGFLRMQGRPEAFELELVCRDVNNTHLYLPAGDLKKVALKDVVSTDLIIVPAFQGDADAALTQNADLIAWLKEMSAKGTEIASLCFGSYFLAEAGLLGDKPCTSHWAAMQDMRQRYPQLNIQPDMVITDQDGIYTSGGAFLSLNLVLYLIEKFCGKEVTVWASKMFSIDIDKVNQAHFAIFQSQRRHEDKVILKAQDIIEKNFQQQLSIDQIAEQSNMSTRNFIRRFKSATNNTPIEYLQRVKIEAAKKALERNDQDINGLMYDAGYNDVKTFRMIFKRITGLTPQEYRKKYSRTITLADRLN